MSFYRIWAVSLVLLTFVILWPTPGSKDRRVPASVDTRVKWLLLHIENDLLLDKFNTTVGSLNFKDNVLYFNSYTTKLFYNRDSISIPTECLIHEFANNVTTQLTDCLIKTMARSGCKSGNAFKRWYGVSIHFSYTGVYDMLNVLEDFAWIDSDFNSKDYQDYDVKPYNNNTVLPPYNVINATNTTNPAKVPQVIMNPTNNVICLAPNVCGNLTNNCLYYPGGFTNVTVNQTFYIQNSQLKNNVSLPTVNLDCKNTTDLSQDIVNYNPAIYTIKQPVTKCCNEVVLKSVPVVNNKDETKFKDKSSQSNALTICFVYAIMNLI